MRMIICFCSNSAAIGYYGADPETVQYLRELGYSYTEIEDFLMYPESYGAELALVEL